MPQEPDIEAVVKGLTQAQRDIMCGHLVDIPPEEADELQALGLKEASFEVDVVVKRTVWPITPFGQRVAAYLKEQSNAG